MEKFSNWRDGPTGIHPLLPPKAKSVSVFGYIIKFVIGPIISIIRVPIILILTALLIIFNIIARSIPIGWLSRMICRFFDIIIGRIILLCMGFIQLDEFTETLSRSKVASGSIDQCTRKDIIICNHSSYVDIIYLCYKFSPTFAIPPNDEKNLNENIGKLIPLTLGRALENSIYSPIQLSSKSVDTNKLVESIQSSWNGPLVIFPEGTTSNGQGLLDISPIFPSQSQSQSQSQFNTFKEISANKLSIHVIGLSYHYGIYSPCYSSVGNVFLHLFLVCCQISNSIQIHYLSRSCMPPPPKQSQLSQYINNNGLSDENEWFDQLFKSLSSLINTRRTKITNNDKLSFISKWKGYKVDYSSKKSN
ncbi:hypothetical protein DDB_G0279277 [Dictyostelium discoideum AX4]|uniref:Phospholipid/glycerol acyltransferase domain-containing protein n=1 Tax=Dictyostelium discoideum TaxID=44689 RepID=Q54X10_DICDI|nr:hypothetical protein DDB_G0279277 [Dictyostelium discoideum AX4]EAL67787.1 hypothetical protein DDB_G0279277 [Dictyostelium discoideum AX4]|eukprot:XP_641767.1 hypothetical protein DDB_G0279277 [Dictyostelium discoideum AX4]